MLQKVSRPFIFRAAFKSIHFVKHVSKRLTSSDQVENIFIPRGSSADNLGLIRPPTCHGCLSILQRRSIHHPTTFQEAVKKPFEWGYGKHNGPDQWHYDFPVAIDGKRQSPIDIDTADVDIDPKLYSHPLRWKYDPQRNLFIENTGRSWTVMVDGSTSGLAGGPLGEEYELWQYHAHWGSTNCQGSEHTIDGKSYPAELHFVHWNSSKYHSPQEAVAQPDGLAVLGVFMEITPHDHVEFSKVCSLMNKIKYRDAKFMISDEIDVEKMLPESDKTYWTYPGSLTTPPLLESVTWILFRNVMRVSQKQIDSMRSLMFNSKEECDNGEVEPMQDNYRKTTQIGDRKVRQC